MSAALTINDEELTVFKQKLIRLSTDLNFVENQKALRFAVAPVLKEMQATVPVWIGPNGTSRLGGKKMRDTAHDRGGATKRDLRIKTINYSKNNEANVIVGVSKAKGKVGWRTHFLIHGTKRMKANPFMIKATERTLDAVLTRYASQVKKIIDKRMIK